MPTEIILLERVEKLGKMGDVVKVKPGYARNFLLPQRKALRATKENLAYFEGQRSALEKLNGERKAEAQTVATKLEGLKVMIIRQASEAGSLYGSVASRDVADALASEAQITIARNQVDLNDAIKSIGLFPVKIVLHPEVKVQITLNIARSAAEAATQEKTGKAAIVDHKADARKAAKEQAEADLASATAAPAAEPSAEETAA